MRQLLIFTALLAFASNAPADDEHPPNVLLIISDDLSAKALGCYGNEVCQTPNIDRLAAQGVRFDRAFCQYPVCGASRASFMSGLYPHTNGILGNVKALGSYQAVTPSLSEHPSIGGFLRRNGYTSIRVSKIYHMGVPGGIEAGEPGGDNPDSWDRAFDVMAPEMASWGELDLLSPKRKHYGSNFARIIIPDEAEATQPDHLATSHAIAIMENRVRHRNDTANFLKPTEPFFLAVGLVRPHVPLIAPERLFELYPPDEMILPEVPEGDLDDVPPGNRATENRTKFGMSDEQARQALAAYYASTTFMDEQVGRLLDSVEQLGISERTIIIFMSDHGWNLGEHDCWQKTTLWEDSVRVPLIVSDPSFVSGHGAASNAMVELIDLYPTIAQAAGLRDAAPDNLQGMELQPLLENPETAEWDRDFIWTVTNGGKGQSIRTNDFSYNHWKDNGEELYDLRNDAGEFTNQATNPEFSEVVDEFRAERERILEEISR